jgi:hypothetical protein
MDLDKTGRIFLRWRVEEQEVEDGENARIQPDADGQSQHCDKGEERRPAGGADGVENVLPVNQHLRASQKPSRNKLRKNRASWQDLALGSTVDVTSLYHLSTGSRA